MAACSTPLLRPQVEGIAKALSSPCAQWEGGFRSCCRLLGQAMRVCTLARPGRRPLQVMAMAPLKPSPGKPKKEVVTTWRSAEAVCFDVDSTVCLDEGVDELAAFCGAGEAVAAWTARAMGGSVPFEDALAARLALFRPSASTVGRFLTSKPPRLSPGIEELVTTLHYRGTHVYLVSGGFRQMIAPVAALLNIPSNNIFANSLLFDENGDFMGFDATEPTSRSGGKATAIEQIKQEHGYQSLVMVGDGATDLEARRPGGADMFICYGGVQARPTVMAGADWFVLSFADLIQSLDDQPL